MKNTRPYMAVTTPMSLTLAARPAKTSDFSPWRPNSLTSIAPATLNRSVMVEPIAASSCIDSLVSRCILRADHVAVQPAHQRAGLGSGEERDRLLLDMPEDLGAQVVDQPLADPRRVPALGDGQERVEDGEPGHGPRDHQDRPGVLGLDLVHDLPEQQRHGNGDDRVQRGGNHEDDELAPVRPGVGRDPPDGARLQPLAGDGAVAAERSHRLPASRIHERTNLRAARDLPGSATGELAAAHGGPRGRPGRLRARYRRSLARCSTAWKWRSAVACWPSVCRWAWASSSLVARAASASAVSSPATRSATAPSSSVPGTTSSASRSSRASRASTLRPVRHSSSARGSPRMSTSGFVPVRSGTSPSAGSLTQSRASSASTRKSQERASWQPAPIACPRTAATDTIRGSRSQVKPCWQTAIHCSKAGSSARGSGSSPGTPSAENIRRSIPAEKDVPAPWTTTTRTRSGSPAPIAARPRHIAGVIALRRCGRLSVTVATQPAGSESSISRRSPQRSRSAGSMDKRPPGRAAKWRDKLTRQGRELSPDYGNGRERGPAFAAPMRDRRAAAQCFALALPRVAPPRPRSETPVSVRIRCTKPYDRPVDAASDLMLSPASYLFLRSAASFVRSAPVTRVPFFSVSVTRTSR